MTGSATLVGAGGEPLEPVRIARTRQEREAVYRLRYEVLVGELDKHYLPHVDHRRRWVRDTEDEDAGITIFYTGTAEAMTGSVRIQVWPPGGIPAAIQTRFSLALFPELQDLRVGEVGRLTVSPGARGRQVVPALACAVFGEMVERRDVPVVFAYCAPGLVGAFRGLGFRPYAGHVISDADGIRLPMLLIGADLSYFESVHSPLTPLVARHVRAHPQLLRRARPILEAVESMAPHYQLDAQQVWHELQERFLDGQRPRPRLFQDLEEADIRTLGEMGLTMEVPAGETVMREGLVEKELFLVLEGSFEGRCADKRIAVMGPGEVFGEVSFFHDPGRRQFTVAALTPGRLLVLRRHAIDALMESRPALASRLLFNLARILARRVASVLQAGPTGAAE